MKCSNEQKIGAADGGACSEMDSLFALLGLFDLYCDMTEPGSGEPGELPYDLTPAEDFFD